MSVRLFVLGLICQGDTHGYEIKATAKLWGVERWARIRDGSIYHALAKLQEEDLIEERPVELSENNRPRYVYSVTPAGRDAFLKLLRETCRTAPTEGREIDMALAFLDHLPSNERAALLQERHERLLKARADWFEGFEDLNQYPRLHPWVRLGMQHSLARIEAEILWNATLLNTVPDWPERR